MSGGAGAAAGAQQAQAQPQAGPRLQHSIRFKAGKGEAVQTFWGSNDVKKADGFESPETARSFEYSKDGNLLAVLNSESVLVFNAQTGALAYTVPRPNVLAVAFSPLNSFLVTWERLEEKVNGNENNLIVWRLENTEPIVKFTQKVFAADLWPSLSWTKDETYFSRVVKTEVHFFAAKTARPSEIARRLQLPNVARVEFSPVPNPPYHLAVFVPEQKSQPGSVRIYAIPPAQGPDSIRATATKSFFRGTSALLMWNSTGTALLASLSTDVDVSGRSYYGETGLYFLTTDASFECMIQLQKEGPIHDVGWSPTGKEFVVTYGFMPNPQTTLFDVKCNPVIDFGTASRNTIRWAPNGKFLCIGGFGNLTGQMDFWDVKSTKKVGTAIAHCAAVCEWAPDSRHFIAAVVSPRIRVDNGYKIFKYDGTLVFETAVNELYQVAWRPRPASAYPDRPLTPPPKAGGAGPSSPSPAQPKPAAAAPAKYRHPHAKETTTSSFTKEDEGVKRYKPAAAQAPEKNLPPGWFDEDEEKQKKKKKKNKKKKGADGSKEDEGEKEVTQGVEGLTVNSPPLTTTTTNTTPTAPSSSVSNNTSSVSLNISTPSDSSSSSSSPATQQRSTQSPKPRNKAPNKK